MMTPYLLSFDETMVTRQQVLDHLNTLPQVLNWYALLPGSILLVSRSPSSELCAFINHQFPTTFIIITEIPRGNNDGWLPQAAWDFINNPKSSGRWEQ